MHLLLTQIDNHLAIGYLPVLIGVNSYQVIKNHVSIHRPRNGATMSRIGGGDYRVTYSRSRTYLFRCQVRDNEGLKGSADMIVNVKDMYGMLMCQIEVQRSPVAA